MIAHSSGDLMVRIFKTISYMGTKLRIKERVFIQDNVAFFQLLNYQSQSQSLPTSDEN